MDSLATEIINEILSRIPLQQLIPLRLVNKLFNELIEGQFSRLTAVNVTEDPKPAAQTQIVRHFNQKPANWVVKPQHVRRGRYPLKFLAMKSPNLQIISFSNPIKWVKLSDLDPFAASLKYFRTTQLQTDLLIGLVKEKWLDFLTVRFPSLVAFHIDWAPYPFCPRLWSSRKSDFILWRDRCILDDCPDCQSSLRNFSTQVIKCYESSERHPGAILDLTPHAQTLELLYVEGNGQCIPSRRIEFPNLKYLTITSGEDLSKTLHLISWSRGICELTLASDLLAISYSDSLRLLSLVRSLPCLRKFSLQTHIKRRTAFEQLPPNDSSSPGTKLQHIDVHLESAPHVPKEWFTDLIKSPNPPSEVRLYFGPILVESLSGEVAYIHHSLAVDSLHPKFHVRMLKTFAKYPLSKLSLSCLLEQISVSIAAVELVLQFDQLKVLDVGLDPSFIESWLPRFVASQNRKGLQLISINELRDFNQETQSLIKQCLDTSVLESFNGQKSDTLSSNDTRPTWFEILREIFQETSGLC